MIARHRALPLALLIGLFCAQLLLAVHSPSHIFSDSDHQELLSQADCQLCTQGNGLLAIPAAVVTPLASGAIPVLRGPTIAPLRRSKPSQYPPRGPPAAA